MQITTPNWRNDPITFGQKASITQFTMNPQAKKFFEGEVWKGLNKLTKGQASDVITLIRERKGADAVLKLKELGIANDIEIIKP